MKLLLLLSILYGSHAKDCVIQKDFFFGFTKPIILGSKYEYIYPKGNSNEIIIPEGNAVVVSCSGLQTKPEDKSTFTLVCNGNGQFEHDTEVVSLEDLECSSANYGSLQYTGLVCAENSEIIKIGYELSATRFVSLVDVCFNHVLVSPVYTNYSLGKDIAQQQLVVISLKEDSDIYNIYDIYSHPLYLYPKTGATLNKQVGLPEDSRKYFNAQYFSPTPLGSTNNDFVYTGQTIITSRILNTFTQWPFETDNLPWLLNDITNFVVKQDLDLQVYVGVNGVVTLPHEVTGEQVEIYEYVDDDGHKAFPWPATVWKLLYHEDSRSAIVFVYVNTPYNVDKNILCKDVSGALDWLSAARGNVDYKNSEFGLIYACSYHKVKGVLANLPELDVIDILM